MAGYASFKWILVLTTLGVAGALAVSILLLNRRVHLVYFGTLGLLAVIVVLSIMDDFGWADLFSLLVSLVPLILMVRDRAWYLKAE